MDHLKFAAFDHDDLDVISAHVHDAMLRVRDIMWWPAEKRLVLAIDRIDWDCDFEALGKDRHGAALRFERVLSCKARHLDAHERDRPLNLIAIEFEDGPPPGGVVTLHFAEGAALRLEVECIECELADIGPARLSA